GTTDVFNSWITRDVRVKVPEQVRIRVLGQRPDNVTAKDFMLEILRTDFVRNGGAIGRIIEYCGDAVSALSIDERATMTNIAADGGGRVGILGHADKNGKFLEARGAFPQAAEAPWLRKQKDDEAEYAR